MGEYDNTIFIHLQRPDSVLSGIYTPRKSNLKYLSHVVKKLADLFNEGQVFFNHLAHVANLQLDTLTSDAAILPPFGYKGCDIIIPIFPPIQKNMSYIIVQVKNRKGDRLSPSRKLDTGHGFLERCC